MAKIRVKDHPRVCGENRKESKLVREFVGSPPRVRGKLCGLYRVTTERGITPACAGKTKFADMVIVPEQDHPRVCGENVSLYSVIVEIRGSPPRVRGKLHKLWKES